MSTSPRILALSHLSTPLGTMLLVTDAEQRLLALDWEDYRPRMHRLLQLQRGIVPSQLTPAAGPHSVHDALVRYFAGELGAIDAIEVVATGTPFQRAVWTALRGIAAGQTSSYGALAQRIGRPAAVRAVGLANGANPIGVVVPCHRVIGADASLTGYGGGLTRKRWLLEHEGAHFGARTHPSRRRARTEAHAVCPVVP
jgi:methylated-DNA-[protein]-cysteine S-methyltransferase